MLDNSKTITEVTYNGNDWPVGGGTMSGGTASSTLDITKTIVAATYNGEDWPVGGTVGETWVINKAPGGGSENDISILFISNDQNFDRLNIGSAAGSSIVYFLGAIQTQAAVFNRTGLRWIDEAYRTVTFLEPPTGDLLTWLQANAVKQ